MAIVIDYSRMHPAISRKAAQTFEGKLRSVHRLLMERRARGELPFYDLPGQEIGGLLDAAARLKGAASDLVVLGIGGSALGLIALNLALRSLYPWAEGRPNLEIPKAFPELEAVAYLGGHTIGELFQAEARATEAALVRAGRPVASVTFPELGPGEVGEFFYWLEVLVVAAGALLGINPLDQPGVEEGKQYAYALLGRPGYEAKLRELQAVESRKA